MQKQSDIKTWLMGVHIFFSEFKIVRGGHLTSGCIQYCS